MRTADRALLVICTLLFVALPVGAEVDVDASLNRETVAPGEIAELTVAISGTVTGVGRPEVPPVDYLSVVSSSSQKSIQFVNGAMRSTTTYTFGIRASREGTYEIPGIEVPVDDRVITTEPLTLRVVAEPSRGSPPGTGPPPSGPGIPHFEMPEAEEERPEPRPDIDATTEVDDPRPYVGEQVTLTLKFIQSHNVSLLGNAEYSPPSTEGLVSEPLPDRSHYTSQIDSTPYEISTRKTALIAPAPGEYTIGPAEITFRRGYMHGEERISTDPITLRVRPLPERGRPEGFSGAVGRLQVRSAFSTKQVKVGEAVSLRVEVSGTGDLRQLEPPEVTVAGNARIDSGGEERDISPRQTPEGYAIGGTVAFDYLIMPREAGELRVNPVTVHYFNPDTERYEKAQASAAIIEVRPGDLGQTSVRDEGPHLRYIKQGGHGLHRRPPVTSSIYFWALQAVPLLGLAWAARRRAEMLHRRRDPAYRRRVEAARNARSKLQTVPRIGDRSRAFRRMDEALAGYIAAKATRSVADISPENARRLLSEIGVGEELAAHASELLRTLRAGAYAPGAADSASPEEMLQQMRRLIDEMEGAL